MAEMGPGSFATGPRRRPIEPFPQCPDCDRICDAIENREVPVTDTQVVNRNQPMLCRLGFSAPQDLLRLIASTAPV
jgi:hypothetical protein